jgi:hypothetical protein
MIAFGVSFASEHESMLDGAEGLMMISPVSKDFRKAHIRYMAHFQL